jgi:phosphoglycolate phosphatase-like HAD superfamily hydrolase
MKSLKLRQLLKIYQDPIKVVKYQHILFDFDGVLAESNEIRFNGFRKLFKDYPRNQVEQLVEYAKANGGVSRYKKIEFFFSTIRKESISPESVNHLANQFSKLVIQNVLEAKPVKGSLEFLKKYFNQFDFAIVSGSDQKELREVCKGRGIDIFFKRILGSPTEKKDNIAKLLSDFEWDRDKSLYVGDSNNDLEAAKANNIDFIGRSSGLVDWKSCNIRFVYDLSSLYNFLH